jgi:AcrR family transcriptional regulator
MILSWIHPSVKRRNNLVKQRESSEVVKDRIIKVATELFAKYGVNGVGIRRIASDAGINHTLIIRYFGTKEGLVTEILRRKISMLTSAHPIKPQQSAPNTLAELREILLNSLAADKNTMKLIVRSGLDGLSPESYVDPSNEKAANLIAKWIQSQQKDEKLPDAKLVSIIIVGAVFSLVSIAPWLMTTVGLPPEDFEKRKEDIMDVMIWMIARSIGLLPDADVS